MKGKERGSLFAAYFILFLDNFGFAVVFPIFPILFLNPEFGILAPATLASTRNLLLGFLIAAFPLGQFFGAPFFGDYGDRWGRKRAFVLTITGTILGYLLTALGIASQSFALLFFSRILTGFFSGNLALALATVADLSPEKHDRGKKMSLVAALLGSSWVLAIIVGAFFTNPESVALFRPAIPFWIVAFLSLLSLGVLFKYFHETHPVDPEHHVSLLKGAHNLFRLFEFKELRSLFLMLLLWFLGFSLSLQWAAPVAIEKFHVSQLSIMAFFGVTGVLWSFSSGFLNRFLVRKFSMWHLTLYALLITSLLYFLVGVSDFFTYYFIAYAISGIPAAIAWSNSMSLISLSASADAQGKAMGIAQSTLALAQFVAPLVGGLIAGYSVEPLFYGCALFVFFSFFLLLATMVTRKTPIL